MVAGESSPFGIRLRQLREAAGLTQEELAERAGLSVKAISALERGRRQRPYPHTVRALADALALSETERSDLLGARPGRSAGAATTRTEQSARTSPPALPTAPTAIIGRDREVADIADLLAQETLRVVTLTGPGGVGKTRLSLEIASHLTSAFDGRVAVVPLAPLTDARLVLPAIAQALGLAEAGAVAIREVLVTHLATERWLLVLDNLEHLLDAAPDIADLLMSCPLLTILVTSRAPLKIRAEREYPLRPLALPELNQVPTLEDVEHVSSVRLFVERAQAVVPAFVLTQANCTAVAAICRRLDGLPLALELVAARLRVLSPTELLARLDSLLPLLVGGSRDLPERQQTMRAAIGWSYALLSPTEQVFFRRLSAFAGGWTLDAAEAVAAWGELAGADAIDLLSNLVEQSLIVAEIKPDGTSRYSMLEPIRQFAAANVEEVGETSDLRNRHLDWCLALTEGAYQGLIGPDQQQWLNLLEQEHDNLRSALAWSQRDPARATRGLHIAYAVWRFWSIRGHLSEGRRWLTDVLAVSDETGQLRALGLNALGNLTRDQADYEHAIATHDAALALFRQLDDLRGVAISLNNIGNILFDRGNYAGALDLYAEAVSHARSLGLAWETSVALHNLGLLSGYLGEYDRATELLDEALALKGPFNEIDSRAKSLDSLGEVARRRGDLDRATALHHESLQLRRAIGDTRGTAITLRNRALVALDRDDLDEALLLVEESLVLQQRIGNKRGIAHALLVMGDVARRQGGMSRAVELYQQAFTLQRQMGTEDGLADCLRGCAAIVVAYDPERAAWLFGASEASRAATGRAIPVPERAEFERLAAMIEQALGTEAFAIAVTKGRAMTPDQAMAEGFRTFSVSPLPS